jgi:hypothetical protein
MFPFGMQGESSFMLIADHNVKAKKRFRLLVLRSRSFQHTQSVTCTALVTPAPPISNNLNEVLITAAATVLGGTPSFGQVGLAGSSGRTMYFLLVQASVM